MANVTGTANVIGAVMATKSDKAARELGYHPGPLEPALRDAITWFRAHGML